MRGATDGKGVGAGESNAADHDACSGRAQNSRVRLQEMRREFKRAQEVPGQ
jgi:hypothetical protein